MYIYKYIYIYIYVYIYVYICVYMYIIICIYIYIYIIFFLLESGSNDYRVHTSCLIFHHIYIYICRTWQDATVTATAFEMAVGGLSVPFVVTSKCPW